jgi:tellurite resistance protein
MEAISTNKAAVFFGPYLVRDAIRMARIDGLGDKERAAISKLAVAVGVSAQNVKSIEALIDQYQAAEAGWISMLKA